jgi:hypothetical protein
MPKNDHLKKIRDSKKERKKLKKLKQRKMIADSDDVVGLPPPRRI